MHYINHSQTKRRLGNAHAFMAPSSPAWFNYTPEKIYDKYRTKKATERGIELHDYISKAVTLRIRAADTDTALNSFINDAIDFNMQSEVFLYYSDNCYGTTDAISFNANILRISDYKSGEHEVKNFAQLKIYAAIFVLEYGVSIDSIEEIILRIYQNVGYKEYIMEREELKEYANKIVFLESFLYD